jgi:protein-arginine kinase activator protein McsA
MICQQCRERDATHHVTRAVDDRAQVEHLCSQCAAAVKVQIVESTMKSDDAKKLSADEKADLQRRLTDILSPDRPPPREQSS